MKKQFIVIVLVLAMLAAFTGTAAAAPLASGSATLVSVVYVPGKGPVFTFEVSGEFSKSDLAGVVHVDGGGDFELHCRQVDAHTVTCTTSKQVAGQNVTLSWGGAIFWASVPKAKAPAVTDPSVTDPAETEYCYSIWDWYLFADDHYEWIDFGPYCQDTPAQQGDEVNYIYTFQDQDLSAISSAWFLEDGICPFYYVPNFGAAYYYCFDEPLPE